MTLLLPQMPGCLVWCVRSALGVSPVSPNRPRTHQASHGHTEGRRAWLCGGSYFFDHLVLISRSHPLPPIPHPPSLQSKTA